MCLTCVAFVQVEVTDNSATYAKLKPSFIDNHGAQLCFQEPDPSNVFLPTNYLYSTELKRCSGYFGALPGTVMFYVEREVAGNHLSEQLTSSSSMSDGFSVSINTTPFAAGTRLVVKAKSTSGSGAAATTTTTTLMGVVASNSPPIKITLDNLIALQENAEVGTV